MWKKSSKYIVYYLIVHLLAGVIGLLILQYHENSKFGLETFKILTILLGPAGFLAFAIKWGLNSFQIFFAIVTFCFGVSFLVLTIKHSKTIIGTCFSGLLFGHWLLSGVLVYSIIVIGP